MTSLPTLRVDRLEKTIATVKANSDRHDQLWFRDLSEFECNTTMCFAGWAINDAPDHPINGEPGYAWAHGQSDYHRTDLSRIDFELVVITHAGKRSWASAHLAARQLLGLTEEEAQYIFYSLDGEVLDRVVDVIARRRSEHPDTIKETTSLS